eukprot:4776668-Pleurochrysis_carterae.AAC.1
MAQSLIKVSSRTFVTLRPKSTQRTAGYAEAKKKRRDPADKAPGSEGIAARWLETAAAKPLELVEAGVERRKTD